MDALYRSAELPLCPVLAEMEQAGFLVDRGRAARLRREYAGTSTRFSGDICGRWRGRSSTSTPQAAGRACSLTSWACPAGKRPRPATPPTPTCWKSSAARRHRRRRAGIPQLTKLKSTYVEGLLKVIDPDGRIHTSFQMTVTATGRLELHRAQSAEHPRPHRAGGGDPPGMFVAAGGQRAGGRGLLPDRAARAGAHVRRRDHDRRLPQGEDIHTVTASQVFGVPLEQVTPDMRRPRQGGQLRHRLRHLRLRSAQDIGVSAAGGQGSISRLLRALPGVRAYHGQRRWSRRSGRLCRNPLRPPPGAAGAEPRNFNVRSFGERVAMNTPIQGTAADIIKLAMVRAADAAARGGAGKPGSYCRSTTSSSRSARRRKPSASRHC